MTDRDVPALPAPPTERQRETALAVAIEQAAKAERKAAQVQRLLKLRAGDDALRVIGETRGLLHEARVNVEKFAR